MYPNSNAFLGANSQRPGGQQPQQYGSFNNIQPGQQQPSPFAPQPTGFGQQQPLQQQYTGYPMQAQPTGAPQPQQGLQQQYTGFPGQGPAPLQQSFQTGAPPVPSIPSQFQQSQPSQQSPFQGGMQPPQQTGFSGSPQPPTGGPTQAPAAMKPQPTGFNEMAASFQTGGGAKPQGRAAAEPKAPNMIPNIRLSFISATDQSKFETLFKSAVGEASTTMSGDKARDLLLRSRLDGDSLSHIW